MEALKLQLLRIQQQLSGLTASQKMLTFSLVIIMIMTMLYWSRYAGSAEKTVLLDQPMSAEEITQIKNHLASKNISYEVQGDRIMVPSDKRFELVAELGYQQLLPRDMRSGFDDIVQKNSNPFDNDSKSEKIWNHAKETTLAGIIRSWPGVKNAVVVIDPSRKINLTRNLLPVANVSITLKPGETAGNKMAEAAAELLVGSQAGLDRSGVKVLINGKAMRVSDPDSGLAGGDNTMLEAKQNWERYYVGKIMDVVHIPEAFATVSVEVNTKNVTMNEKVVDPKGVVQIVKRTSTSNEENTQAAPAGEPGAGANTSATIEGPSNASAGGNSTIEKSETENDTDHSVKNVTTQALAGDGMPIAAAVNIPESHLINLYKRRNPTSKEEPTAAVLEKLLEEQSVSIRRVVQQATAIKDEKAISIASYIDFAEPVNPADAASATLASMPAAFGFGAKEIAIGVLAIVSLFMVSMMVRKSTPQPVLQTPDDIGGAIGGTAVADAGDGSPGAISGNAALAGMVGEGGLMLTGHELSESELESKQVIEQVGAMVKENPEVAANLVKRWLNRN